MSCKTKFWVNDQNRKYFPGVADTVFLRSRPKTTPTLAPGQTSSTAKSEVDSRLLARHPDICYRRARDRLPTFGRHPTYNRKSPPDFPTLPTSSPDVCRLISTYIKTRQPALFPYNRKVGRYPPMQPDLRSTMGNGVSGDQGNLPSRGKRDVRTSIVKAQRDWQQERAVAPKQETLSLPDVRNTYICTTI